MKRPEPSKPAIRVYSIYPILFWKTCTVCHQQFRRERGWWFHGYPKAETLLIMTERPMAWYVCHECAPTPQDAIKIAKEKVIS